MRKLLIILFVIIYNIGYSQFSCVKTIVKDDCRISLLNANGIKVGDLDLSQTSWYFQSATNIKVSDNVNVFNLLNTCITSPTWASLPDSLTSWQTQCVGTAGSVSVTFPSNLDTTQVDTSLVNYSAKFDTTINRLDSILANLKTQTSKDTTHTAILQFIQDSLNSKLSRIDKSDIDTSLVQVIQLNQIIDSLSVLINKPILDTTHEAILNNIYTLIGKLDTSSVDTSLTPQIDYTQLFYALINKGYDTSQVDTALDKHILLDSTQVRILNDSIKVWFTQPLEVSKDTTHQSILSEIKELLTVINSRIDTTQIDTSLTPAIDYTQLLYALINKSYDTSQIDTALDKHILLDSTLVRIINDTLNVRFVDSTYYTTLDSIKYYLSQNDSIEICFDTITFNSYVTNLPTTICNGDSAVRVQLCNTDSTLNAIVRTKIDTTNAILYRIENGNVPTKYDVQEHFELIGTGNTITFSANTYHSIRYTIIGGSANVEINGTTINALPSGYTANYESTTLLTNQITITTVSSVSRVIITTIK